jgi:hypothetical protein
VKSRTLPEPLFATPGDLEQPAASHRDDPHTSREAASSLAPIIRGQRLAILEAYRPLSTGYRAGYIDDEAAHVAGLERHAGRRRSSELRDLGYIEPVRAVDPATGKLRPKPETRVNIYSGRRAVICRITDAGLHALELARRASS